MGHVDLDTLQTIQNSLTKIFPNTTCRIATSEAPIPKEAYNATRRQYSSTQTLMKVLEYTRSITTDRTLGVTSVDLYVPWLNFVFGEAQCLGRVAVISIHRLRPEFYRQPTNPKLFLERVVKESVHELGHTFGLLHCKNSSCVMYFSNSIADTDLKNANFCKNCTKRLKGNLKGLGL